MDDNRDRHDFKNQLGIILGFSEILLADARPGDPRRGDFEEIHTAAAAALALLARLYRITPPPGEIQGRLASERWLNGQK